MLTANAAASSYKEDQNPKNEITEQIDILHTAIADLDAVLGLLGQRIMPVVHQKLDDQKSASVPTIGVAPCYSDVGSKIMDARLKINTMATNVRSLTNCVVI